MKKTPHIVFSLLLMEAILFNQIAFHFFHYNHDTTQSYHVKKDRDQIQTHREHCKICSLETLHHLFFQPHFLFHFEQPESATIPMPNVDQVVLSPAIFHGRAPPVI